MSHLLSDRSNRGGFRGSLYLALGLGLFMAGSASNAHAQEELTLPELDGQYRGALLEYGAAYQALEVLESQYERASQDFNAALLPGDEAARDAAYVEIRRISGLIRQAQRRVEDKVEILREARTRFRAANAEYLEDLLARYRVASDSVVQGDLLVLMEDTRNQINELLTLEDPPVTLEPVQDLNAEPRDGPVELRAKASLLELTANQYEETYIYAGRQLADLRRDQNLLRTSGDFLAGIIRFDDPRLPVGPPGARTDPPPGQAQAPPGADSLGIEGGFLTLEQRIEALETLQEEITQRIQTIRVRAANLRRLAGGEWA